MNVLLYCWHAPSSLWRYPVASTDPLSACTARSSIVVPDTEKSPGAKAAQVGTFMAVMVTDCYEPSNQQIFRDGMKQLDEACVKTHKTSFMSATPAQRTQLLETLDRDAKCYMDGKTADTLATTTERGPAQSGLLSLCRSRPFFLSQN